MFIGHFAAGFAAKRAVPNVSLGLLMAAAILLDLLWPVFLMLGWERVRIDPGNTAFTPLVFDSYPISHSLLASVGWAALCGVLYRLFRRDGRGALVLAALVLSHWVLDAISHRPDLPLVPGGSARIGLGLWNSVLGTLAAEGVMFAIGVWLYLVCTRARDWVGRWSCGTYIGVLVAIYLAGVLGPPPPDWPVVAWTGLAIILFVSWAAWFDRHRIAG